MILSRNINIGIKWAIESTNRLKDSTEVKCVLIWVRLVSELHEIINKLPKKDTSYMLICRSPGISGFQEFSPMSQYQLGVKWPIIVFLKSLHYYVWLHKHLGNMVIV